MSKYQLKNNRSDEFLRKCLKHLINTYTNDAKLGAEIRKLYKE